MVNRAALQAVNCLLQTLTGSTEPFGGKFLIAVGDFRQVAPVVRGGGLAAVIDASVRMSPLWDLFHINRLTRPMRNAADPEFCQYIDDIGEDAMACCLITLQHLPTIPDAQEALAWLYPPNILQQPDVCMQRAFLTTLNARVDELNQLVLDQLPGNQGMPSLSPPFPLPYLLASPSATLSSHSLIPSPFYKSIG